MTEPTLILSDLDGVLVDLVAEGRLWVWQRFGVVVPERLVTTPEITDSLLAILYANGVKEDEAELRRVFGELWEDPRVYQDARPHCEMWAALRGYGALEFVTKRPCRNKIPSTTRLWLGRYGLDPGAVQFAEEPFGKPSIAAARLTEHAEVVFIEDNVFEAMGLAAHCPRLNVWLVDRPWNFAAGPKPPNLFRYPELEIAETIHRWRRESGHA